MKKLILVVVAVAITVGAYAQVNNNQNQNLQNNPQDVKNTQKQNLQNNSVGKSQADGVMMLNGKMMVVKNGKVTNLDRDMTMSNGTRIMSDGTCIKKDGTKVMMKEGQHLDMSGNMTLKKANKENNMYLVPDSTKKKKNY